MKFKADLILKNGDIRTQNQNQPRAGSLALANGRIMALDQGSGLMDLAGPETEVIDLNGRLVLPGFWDCHLHYPAWAMGRLRLELAGATSFGSFMDLVAGSAGTKAAGDWIIGQGWNEAEWPENKQPTARDLDRVSPDNPVLLWRCDMHMAAANSLALKMAGLGADTLDPPEGQILRDEKGNPNGLLREAAIDLVSGCLPLVSDSEMLDAFCAGQKALHSLGITGVTDVPLMNDRKNAAQALRVWQRMHETDQLALRTFMALPGESLDDAINLGLRTGLGGEFLKIGPLKYFADGGMGARTAWMIEPYLDGGRGLPLIAMKDLEESVNRADAAGLAVMIHAIGDRANREVVGIFERLLEKPRVWGPRLTHRMEHVQMIRPEDLARLGRLNVAACVQPPNMVIDINMIEECVGEKAAWTYCFQSLLQAGTTILFSSDAPVCNIAPLFGIHAAVRRQRPDQTPAGGFWPEQRVGLEQAVQAYTLSPARAYGADRDHGSLAPGKKADLVVLDRNIYEGRSGEILGTSVDLTVVDGRVVFRRAD